MAKERQLQPAKIEEFVRSRVEHKYNKQIFSRQLSEEIENNLVRLEKSMIKDLKRKLILQNQSQIQLKKREKMRKNLEEKLDKSKINRQKSYFQKQQDSENQKKFRKELFMERLSQIKQKEVEKWQQNTKKIEEKLSKGPPVFNKIERSVSLIQEPHYKKKIQMDQMEYQKLKTLAQEKEVFKGKNLHKRQLSMLQVRPRENIYEEIQKERINRLGEHMERIDQSRKKKESMITEKLKNMQFAEKYAAQQRSQRIRLLLQSQKQRQESIIAKLSKSGFYGQVRDSINSSSPKSRKTERKIENPEPQLLKGSIIFEQSQSRQKHSFRKQIKQQIREFMTRQKQKLLNK